MLHVIIPFTFHTGLTDLVLDKKLAESLTVITFERLLCTTMILRALRIFKKNIKSILEMISGYATTATTFLSGVMID